MLRRVRRRYLALEIVSEQSMDIKDLTKAVWEAVHRLFGEYGASQVNLRVIEYDQKRSYAIVRCSHKALRMVRASITSVTSINEKPASIHVVGVSGTLKSLRKNSR